MRSPKREASNFVGWIIVGAAGICAVSGLVVVAYNAVMRWL